MSAVINATYYATLKQIADIGLANIEISKNDFYDDAGLLICGECGEYKEDFLVFDGFEPILRARQCKCMRERLERERAAEEEQKHASRVKALKAGSGMIDRNAEAKFEVWKKSPFNEKNFKICKRYADKFPELFEKNQGLMLWGGVGTGKSFAASCIANAVLEQGISVYMTSAIKLSVDDPKVLSAKLLIVDDFGAERKTEYAAEKVFNALNERYNSGKPLIITTNMSPDELANESDIRYVRMYDRLQEICYPIQFTGVSYRAGAAINLRKQMKALLEDD